MRNIISIIFRAKSLEINVPQSLFNANVSNSSSKRDYHSSILKVSEALNCHELIRNSMLSSFSRICFLRRSRSLKCPSLASTTRSVQSSSPTFFSSDSGLSPPNNFGVLTQSETEHSEGITEGSLRAKSQGNVIEQKAEPFPAKIPPCLDEFKKAIRTWHNLEHDLENFPYFITDRLKTHLRDIALSRTKYPHLCEFGGSLPSGSPFVLLSGQCGTEEYQEELGKALAKEIKANYLVVCSNFLSPRSDESSMETDRSWPYETGMVELDDDEEEEDDDDDDVDEEELKSMDAEGMTEKLIDINRKLTDLKREIQSGALDGMRDISVVSEEEEEEGGISGHSRTMAASADAFVRVFGRNCLSQSWQEDSSSSPPWFGLKLRDRVQFSGRKKGVGKDWSESRLEDGRYIWVHKDINGAQLESSEGDVHSESDGSMRQGCQGTVLELSSTCPGLLCVQWDDGSGTTCAQESRSWVKVSDIEALEHARAPLEADVRTEALFEVIREHSAAHPLVVLLRQAPNWTGNVSMLQRAAFTERVQALVQQVQGLPVVFLGMSTQQEAKPAKEKAAKDVWPVMAALRFRDSSLRRTDLHGIFSNCLKVDEPQFTNPGELARWREMTSSCQKRAVAQKNRELISKVLEASRLECPEGVPDISSEALLGTAVVEELVGLARAVSLSRSAGPPCVVNGRLQVDAASFQEALRLISAVQRAPAAAATPAMSLESLISPAPDEHEQTFLSEVVPPSELGVTFDDVGALEDAKQALRELVSLPLSRPELFQRGSLAKPVKGVLMFGPPGTGKTLLAKAVATEAGANFINVTAAAITSKWYGDAERRTRALFSLARKLAPCVVFVDEVDSLLGARGAASEHEATRKMRNEFMAAWDGLRSSDAHSDRVLVLAATNRPFDLDDAVIRRMPRRIMIGLPDAANRAKILGKLLGKEELQAGFAVEQLAAMTQGYSGSDLKNLCVAAAYRPIREFLKKEEDSGPEARLSSGKEPPSLRPIAMDDFAKAMAEVSASVSKDSHNTSELLKWNQLYGEGGSRKSNSFGFLTQQDSPPGTGVDSK